MKQKIVSNLIWLALVSLLSYFAVYGGDKIEPLIMVVYIILIVITMITTPLMALFLLVDYNSESAGKINKALVSVANLNKGITGAVNKIKSIISISLLIYCGFVAIPVALIFSSFLILWLCNGCDKWVSGYKEHNMEK